MYVAYLTECCILVSTWSFYCLSIETCVNIVYLSILFGHVDFIKALQLGAHKLFLKEYYTLLLLVIYLQEYRCKISKHITAVICAYYGVSDLFRYATAKINQLNWNIHSTAFCRLHPKLTRLWAQLCKLSVFRHVNINIK